MTTEFCAIRSGSNCGARVGQLLMPSPRTRTEKKPAARHKSNRKTKFFMQQVVRERTHKLKFTEENY